MNVNQIRLMMIPLLATLIMAGFVTTMGLLAAAAAEKYAVDVVTMSSQFFYFTGGVFLGGIFSYFVYDYFAIKPVVITCYLLSLAVVLTLHISTSFSLLPWLLFILGNLLAIVGCGGVMIVTRYWQGKARQTILVAQDIMFNGGGVVFAAAATWFVLNKYSWSTLYIAVCILITMVILCATLSSFGSSVYQNEDEGLVDKTEWNAGIILVGISLLFFMLAKISIFVWAPQFVRQTFDVSAAVSGQFMANVFTTAFLGSLAGTWIASRIDVKYLLFSLVCVSAVSIFLFTRVNESSSILLLGYAYGLSVSVTFNSYMAYGLSLVGNPSHKNVVYLQLAGGLGSALAPFVSSRVMEFTGESSVVIQFCFYTLLAVIVFLLMCEYLLSLRRR